MSKNIYSYYLILNSIYKFCQKKWILDNPKYESESDKLLGLDPQVDLRLRSGYGSQVEPTTLIESGGTCRI